MIQAVTFTYFLFLETPLKTSALGYYIIYLLILGWTQDYKCHVIFVGLWLVVPVTLRFPSQGDDWQFFGLTLVCRSVMHRGLCGCVQWPWPHAVATSMVWHSGDSAAGSDLSSLWLAWPPDLSPRSVRFSNSPKRHGLYNLKPDRLFFKTIVKWLRYFNYYSEKSKGTERSCGVDGEEEWDRGQLGQLHTQRSDGWRGQDWAGHRETQFSWGQDSPEGSVVTKEHYWASSGTWHSWLEHDNGLNPSVFSGASQSWRCRRWKRGGSRAEGDEKAETGGLQVCAQLGLHSDLARPCLNLKQNFLKG